MKKKKCIDKMSPGLKPRPVAPFRPLLPRHCEGDRRLEVSVAYID